ncbi:MAG: 7-cyano-7-deazaguanine synthase [Devosia nanyangense]|uniref:7-cyano-7-deazaguanine synthase n=1 Tax=Devosia nanyangense TaxID=1228055 RepID=A0A933L0N3_9HYPH|nr:7-cyano-7-deazaguanine synthase [Devosia nanyangense]
MNTSAESGMIVAGIHAGTNYYDCSPDFVARVTPLVEETTDSRFSFWAPLLRWSKPEIYSYFRASGIDQALTYSCEAGTLGGCGVCSSCLDRRRL